MTNRELIKILETIDCDAQIVIEDEKGKTEASHVSLFVNTNGVVVAIIE